jgi:hypothetical protein
MSTRLLSCLVTLCLFVARAAADDLPADAKKVFDSLSSEVAQIEKRAAEEIQAAQQRCLDELQKLQESYTKAGKLDEAVAIRDTIRAMKEAGNKALPDPGDLRAYRDQVGKSFFFEVTGATTANIWGGDLYSDDSPLATAAVHAGVLQPGVKGIVRVTMAPRAESYPSVSRNGVISQAWSNYSGVSYRVEAAGKMPPKPAAKLPTP